MSDAPKKVFAVGYVRGSTDEQEKTLQAQEQRIREYVAYEKTLELVDLLVDKGVSATKPLAERKQGSLVVGHVRRKSVNAVIATKLDRLFRSTLDCLVTTSEWDARGVALHVIDFGGGTISTASAVGRFMLTQLAAVGELERGMTSERTATVLKHMREKGLRTSGSTPYGYRFEKRGEVHVMVPDEAEIVVVHEILDMHARGMSMRNIAGLLNDKKAPTRGKRWHATTVARILRQAKKTPPPTTSSTEDAA